MLVDPLPLIEEVVIGPARDREYGFSIGGDTSRPSTVEKGSGPSQYLSDSQRVYRRTMAIFQGIIPRRCTFFTYSNLMQPPNIRLLEETLGCNNSMGYDLWECIKQKGLGANEPLEYVEDLFTIIYNDTQKLLRLIRAALREIDEGTLDDALLQAHLTHWRVLISHVQHELPDTLKSISGFVSFCKEMHVLYGVTGSQEKDSIDIRLECLQHDVNDVLRQGADTYKSLLTNISIIDSKRGIAEAEAVTKLTELAVS
jgi:hypothetical protein